MAKIRLWPNKADIQAFKTIKKEKQYQKSLQEQITTRQSYNKVMKGGGSALDRKRATVFAAKGMPKPKFR